MPAEDKAVKPTSTDHTVPPLASNDRPAIGAKSSKVQYLLSSAKALAEAAATYQQSSRGSGLEEEEESKVSFFDNLPNWFSIFYVTAYMFAYVT
jgi:hypothetical protein